MNHELYHFDIHAPTYPFSMKERIAMGEKNSTLFWVQTSQPIMPGWLEEMIQEAWEVYFQEEYDFKPLKVIVEAS